MFCLFDNKTYVWFKRDFLLPLKTIQLTQDILLELLTDNEVDLASSNLVV